MSSSSVIAATTAVLRDLLLQQIPQLDEELADLDVTTQPPDLAHKDSTRSQLNVFLYRTTANAAWRNMDVPRQVRPGEAGVPPLAIDLHYLLTAYGRDNLDTDALSLRVLGGAMSVLHDNPLLDANAIRSALDASAGWQMERLRVTPSHVNLDEFSKLWATFQTPYRTSALYEVSVVLIDSRAPGRAALPVLQRGDGDRGVLTTTSRAPVLSEVRLPRAQPAARLGEDVVIVGENIPKRDASARLRRAGSPTTIELPVVVSGAHEARLRLPALAQDANAFGRWQPGVYGVGLVVAGVSGRPPLLSNEIVLAIAPTIELESTTAGAGTVNLTVRCRPRIATDQRVLLLFGDRPVTTDGIENPPDTNPPHHGEPTTLRFEIDDVASGSYLVRLRVDGVDSIPVVYSGTPPIPAFDPAQRVEVT